MFRKLPSFSDIACFLSALFIALVACGNSPKENEDTSLQPLVRLAPRHIFSITPKSTQDTIEIFNRYDINLSNLREGSVAMPAFYFVSLPKDLNQYAHVSKRQETFILSILPIILKVNAEIEKDRHYLLSLTHPQKLLSPSDCMKLQGLAEKYKLQTTNPKMMLDHIDIIPPSLAVAQACLETGWGSSFAARHKNSLFGMTVAKVVQPYKSLYECTWTYMRNLNYNRAYIKFRKMRSHMRKSKKNLDSLRLLSTLTEYCEFTRTYLRDLKRILIHYNLAELDHISLVKQSQKNNTFGKNASA